MGSVIRQRQAVGLDWTHPGPAERAIAAEFIQSEDQMNPDAPYAVPATFNHDKGKFDGFETYAHLQHALRLMLPAVLNQEVPPPTTSQGWNDVCDKVLRAQQDYTERQQSSWRKIWHGVGKASGNVDVWVGWIPDEFGLAVVKAGLAVVIKLAGKSLEKRQKILKAFEAVQEAIASAQPCDVSFQARENVAKASGSLYQAIVDSVEDLILLATEERNTWRRVVSKLEHRKKKIEVDTVLQYLSEKSEALKRAVGVARDKEIQTTGATTRFITMQNAMTQHDMDEKHKRLNARIDSLERQNSDLSATIRAESDRTMEKLAKTQEHGLSRVIGPIERLLILERSHDERTIDHKNWKMDLFLEARNYSAIVTMVEQERLRRVRRGPIISPEDFWKLLAEQMIDEEGPEDIYVPDNAVSTNHPIVDLEYVFMYRGDMSTRASRQAETLLRQERFLTWMNQTNPDLILVNANIRSGGEGRISPMSIFCADLIGCLAAARREDVVVHFFCGLHCDEDEDTFPGPAGLVRSLILQVFLKLIRRNRLNLDFLHDRRAVEALEKRDLGAMCHTLYELLHDFPAGTRVFCIIDSVAMLDTIDAFRDLEAVMGCLRAVVEDRRLPASVKVLMVNSSTCSMDLQSLPVFEERPDRIINLSSGGLMPGGLSTRGMRRHISRSSSPTFSVGELGRMDERRRSYHDYESDEGYSYY